MVRSLPSYQVVDILPRRYRLVEHLGGGAAGEVFKAVDDVSGRTVAVKFIRPFPGVSQQLEFELLCRLKHPHIVEVFDYGAAADGSAFLVMAFIQAVNFDRIMRAPDPAVAGELAVQAANTLRFLHSRRILHGDLKPDNLLVEQRQTGLHIFLSDFGLARLLKRPRERFFGGTFPYIAPEAVLAGVVDTRSDLFSLGMILTAVLLGEQPVSSKDRYFEFIREGPIFKRIRERLLSFDIGRFVEGLIHPDPDRRYQSADIFLAAVAEEEAGGLSGERAYPVMPPLIGRKEPMRRVLTELDSFGGRRFGCIYIAGADGSGKTRFLNACYISARLKNLPATWLSTVPGRVLDNIRNLISQRSGPAVSSVDQAVSVLSEMAVERPWILMVDDWEHLDTASQKVFLRLITARPGGLFLLFTCKEAPSNEAETILLKPISQKDVCELIRKRFTPPLPDFIIRRVLDFVGHQPGHIIETLDAMFRRGKIYFRHRRWRWNPDIPFEAVSGSAAAAEKIGRLSKSARRLAAAAACMEDIERALLLSDSIVSECDVVPELLEELVSAEVLERSGTGEWRFSDIFVQAAAAASAPRNQRRKWHLAAAEYFKGIPGRIGDAGRHYLAAGETMKAVSCLFEAALSAAAAGGTGEALELFRLIREAGKTLPPAEGRRILAREALERGNAWVRSGDLDAARNAYIECIRRWKAGEDPRLMSLGLSNLAVVSMKRGRGAAARRYLRQAQQIASSAGLKEQQAMHLLQLGSLYFREHSFPRAASVFREALNALSEKSDPKLKSAAFNNLGSALEAAGDLSGALKAYEKALPLKRAAGDTTGTAILRHNIGHILLENGFLNRARSHFSKALAAMDPSGDLSIRTQLNASRARLEILAGRFRIAGTYLDEAERSAGAEGSADFQLYVRSIRGLYWIFLGKPAAAVTSMEPYLDRLPVKGPLSLEAAFFLLRLWGAQALAEARGFPEPNETASWLSRLPEHPLISCEKNLVWGASALSRNDPDDARSHIQNALTTAKQHGFFLKQIRGCLLNAEADILSDDPERCLTYLRNEDFLKRMESSRLLPFLMRWSVLLEYCYNRLSHHSIARTYQAAAERLFQKTASHLPPNESPDTLVAFYGKIPEKQFSGIMETRLITKGNAMDDIKKLMMLLDVTQSVNTAGSLEDLISIIVDKAIELTGAERGFCYLEPFGGSSDILVCRNITRKDIFGRHSRISRSVMDQVTRTGKPVHIHDSLTEDTFKNRKSILAWHIRKIMCAPIHRIDLTGRGDVRGEAAGVLYVDGTASGPVFSELDRRIFEALSAHAAIAIENLRLRNRLMEENADLRREVRARFRPDCLVGTSPPMQAVHRLIEKIAPSNANVLILGESGTGKELVARTIHFSGPRSRKPFLGINCAALAESVLESELFGVEAGVATGVSRRQGLFVQADGGTLFLDEIGDMPLSMQAKILRVLQERSVRPVGGKKTIDIDVRIVCATNKDLWQLVREKQFREDLLYRLDVVSIQLPPLRERREDIPLLARFFLERHAKAMNKSIPHISQDAMTILESYHWPGNVRELENQMERALILVEPGQPVTPDILSARLKQPDSRNQTRKASSIIIPDLPDNSLRDAVDELERSMILKALDITRGNKKKAAALLGLSREGLRLKIRRLNI